MRFIVGSALSGMAWGSSAILLFPIDSLAHQTFLVFVLGGMVAGTAAAFSSVMKAFLAYSVPALSPIIVRFALLADEFHLAMGGMALLFGIMMFFIAKRIATVRITSVKLRFEKDGLVSYLTEHKRLEEALRESEEKYRTLLEQSLQGTFVIQDMRIVFANQAFANMRRYTIEELYSHSPEEVVNMIHPDDQEKIWGRYRERLEGMSLLPTYNVLRAFRKDGSIGWVEYDAVRINYGGRPAIQISVVEITERMEAEKALRESEERFRSLVETTSDWVWEVDKNGFYTYASPKVKELLGYDPEEVIGKKPFDFMPPEEAEGIARLFGYISKSRKPFTRLENTNVHKDGHLVILETNGIPIFDKGGNYAGYRGIDRDITARKRAEEDRKSLEARMQRMEKMEALGTLAGGVAHDLNNILSGIVGYPDLILMQLPDESPLRESILAIKRSGQKAAEVVAGLVTLARRGMVPMEVMNWNRVISDYMKSPEQGKIQSLHPNVSFEVLLESDLLPIRGSRVNLSNTLMNLLSNAAEAIPEKGAVTIMTRNQYLDRPIKGYDNVKEGDYVVLEVSDTGRGISAEDMGRIFEPFYTRKMKGRSGTGLGLAVVWGTVKDHNGYIDVYSEEGRRTTFTLYFPVTREALTLDQSQISLSDYMGKGESIFVVDDVREQRELVVAMLNKLNYRVTSVSSGEEAIETAKIQQPDLLILDMIMDPGIDGFETYRRFLELHPGQKAIIVSGFSETERVSQALDLGAGAFVKKPYTLEKIGQAVRRELDKCSPSTLNL
jgi:PAS domain S-box-containing protein